MRVGKVAGHVYLVRLDGIHKVLDNVHVHLAAGQFAYAAALIEWQVQEVDVVIFHAEGMVCPTGLASADGGLDIQQFTGLGFAGNLGIYQSLHLCCAVAESELICGIHVLHYHRVMNGHVSGCLIGNMHIMSLMHQADEGAAHGDYIVIRMGRKDEDLLGEGL